jgi:hypothetical protein
MTIQQLIKKYEGDLKNTQQRIKEIGLNDYLDAFEMAYTQFIKDLKAVWK